MQKLYSILWYALFCLVANLSLPVCLASPQHHEPASIKLRILCIDGGGVRGVIPARILQAIEEETGKPIAELFDLVIGNSTGGLVGLALVTPDEQAGVKYAARDLVNFYEQQSPHIFHASLIHKLKSGWGLWGPKYNRRNLDRALKRLFKDVQLSQTLKPALVVSYSLDQGLPHLWTTQKAQQGIHHNYYLRDVAGATSAAPTYFSPKILKDLNNHLLHEVDGGIWANNPEFVAVMAKELTDKISLQDVVLVSLGTGNFHPNKEMRHQQASKLKNAGAIGWLLRAQPNLIEIMIGANSEWSEAVISRLYPNSYRFQVPIPQALANMDNSNHVPQLKQLAELYLQDHHTTFKKLCDHLITLSQG
jgi:patatin-like phospholipase/acyl hydrolase